MNNRVTSRGDILAASRALVRDKGIQAVNMRSVAAACQVALGSIYNYFPSKAELMAAVVADVWQDIFQLPKTPRGTGDFMAALDWFISGLVRSRTTYPDFFKLHALGFVQANRGGEPKQLMEAHIGGIKDYLLQQLVSDTRVRPGALGYDLQPKGLVDSLFDSFLTLMGQGVGRLDPLMTLVRRSLY
ncbi:MAG: TetR/AcrR family transcriptional regulator [Clostridiales bacterium]|nr:TetR/AcrR family transcriptional regulator [Clostridiales bacterium]